MTDIAGQPQMSDWFRATPAARAHRNARKRANRAKNRRRVLAHYGEVCACCGTSERITIDHVSGDGNRHREQLGGDDSHTLYAWLIRHGFPQGFQALCRPCNTSKANGDRCRLDHDNIRRHISIRLDSAESVAETLRKHLSPEQLTLLRELLR